MFNLERAIADWRRQMSGIKPSEALDEFECHLRDDIEEQLRSGTDAAQAFELAAHRIGAARALRKEFAKSGRLGSDVRPRFLRIFYFLAAAAAVLIDGWTLVSFDLSPLELVVGGFAVVAITLYVFRLPFASWWGRGVPHPRFPGMMKAAGILVQLWIWWAILTALHVIQVEIGIIPAMVMWSLCAAYSLTALACMIRRGNGEGSGSSDWLQPLRPGLQPISPTRRPPAGTDIQVPPARTFSSVAQDALQAARKEAIVLGHDFIGTEHVLLGALKMAKSAMAQVLQQSHVSIESVRAEIYRLIAASPAQFVSSTLPFTPRARRALQLAGIEAAALKHPSIGAEHIVLGLLREGGGVAALALNNLGIRIDRMRNELIKAWGNQHSV